MNYFKIHDNLLEYCKHVSIRERLMKRNSLDERLLDMDNEIYTEKHHIIPKHAGGTDDKLNLIELLPEEHFLIHYLRYKMYNDRNDFLSIRLIKNGLYGKNIPNKMSFLKKISFTKQMIYNFKKQNSWHTENGKLMISNARKNKIPVKDSNGVIIGSVPIDHKKVISGEWIHISSGHCTYYDENGEKIYLSCDEAKKRNLKGITNSSGINNSNYKELTLERQIRLHNLIPECIVENHLISNLLEKAIKREFTEFKKISIIWIKNNYGSLNELINEYNSIHDTNYQFNNYFRSTKQREHYKKIYTKE